MAMENRSVTDFVLHCAVVSGSLVLRVDCEERGRLWKVCIWR
jgi:hypothetical protein